MIEKGGYPIKFSKLKKMTKDELIKYIEELFKSAMYFKHRNKNDVPKAIQLLDEFTDNWCKDLTAPDEEIGKVYRCSECSFSVDHKCLVKVFLTEKAPNIVEHSMWR